MRNDVFDVLSDDALLERMEDLVRRERRMTFNVVMHLGEVERRGIHRKLGHHSMFDYCTRRLKYSESEAYRRLKSSRCVREYPEVATLLGAGDLTIATVAMLAGVITRENNHELLAAVRGKSQRAVDRIVAGYRIGKPFRDRIKAVVVDVPVMSLKMAAARDRETPPTSATPAGLGQNPLHDEGKNDPIPEERTNADRDAHAARRRETYYQFTIAADEEFMAMYRQVQAILATRANPGEDISATFKGLMREYIERHAPEKKQARRARRKERTRPADHAKAKGQTADAEPPSPERPRDEERSAAPPQPPLGGHSVRTRSRHIPAATKDIVRTRDGNQCTYMAPDGTRCSATRHLQFDHITPFARCGDHTPDNLRLLCAAHNQLEAEGLFGVRVARRG